MNIAMRKFWCIEWPTYGSYLLVKVAKWNNSNTVIVFLETYYIN